MFVELPLGLIGGEPIFDLDRQADQESLCWLIRGVAA